MVNNVNNQNVVVANLVVLEMMMKKLMKIVQVVINVKKVKKLMKIIQVVINIKKLMTKPQKIMSNKMIAVLVKKVEMIELEIYLHLRVVNKRIIINQFMIKDGKILLKKELK